MPERGIHVLERGTHVLERGTHVLEGALARLDSGRPLETEQVDRSRIAGPDHQWRLDLPADPVTITGDTQRLHQVLGNILANARTHTPPGTTVTTSIRTQPDRVLITIADNGPGIPPELLPDVFERFARGERSRSRTVTLPR